MIETINLAAAMGEEELRTIGRLVVDEFEADNDSRSSWLTMHGEWLSLFYQNDKPKQPPWPNSSTESMPLLAEAVTQFFARASKQMFRGDKFVSATPTGKIDEYSADRAKRVGQHMDWQLMTRDRKFKKHKKKLLSSLALHGSCFTKTYPDFTFGYRPCISNVRAQDLVIPYGVGPRDIEDIERKTEIIHLSVTRTEALAADGWFLHPAEPYTKGDSGDAPTKAHDKAHGLQESGRTSNAMKSAQVLEQHRLLSLVNPEPVDGSEAQKKRAPPEPYIVTVDRQTAKVLRIAPRYEVKQGRKVPVEYFTPFEFLPNPDGMYGLGFGHLIGKLNTAINKLLRMTVDSAELANVGNMSGFVSDVLGVQGGEIELELGKFRKINAGSQDLSAGIFQFKFPGPVAAIGEVIAALAMRADRIATITEALTGQTENVMQPTTVLALIDQGLEIYSNIIGGVIESEQEELDKVFRLNRMYMDDEEYFAVLDIGGTPQGSSVTKKDYADDLKVTPTADPHQSTKQQEMAQAQAEWQLTLQSPLTAGNPQALMSAQRRLLQAMGSRNIDEILPPVPGMAPRQDDAKLENFGALLQVPVIPPVYPDQDHMLHLLEHTGFMGGPFAAKVSPQGMQAMAMHIANHQALRYLTEGTDAMEQLDGQAIPIGMGALAPTPMQPGAPGSPGGQAGAGAPGAAGNQGPGGAPPPPGGAEGPPMAG